MITRENYEAFYLDFLEGTLSKEMERAFLAFLDANPDLQISDDELPILEEETTSLTEFEKLLLKKNESLNSLITKENIEFFLVAQLENQLSEGEKQELERWLALHPEFLKDKALYAKTILPQEKVNYLHKSDLYQDAKIIPLWARVSSIAASVILLIGIGSYLSLNAIDVENPNLPQFSKQNTIPSKTDSLAPIQYAPKQQQFASHKQHIELEPNKNNDAHSPIEDNHMASSNNDAELKQNKAVTNQNGGMLPDQPDLATHVTEKNNKEEQEAQNDYAFGIMENPIQPITNELSKRLNTVIDFRRAKENQDKQSGFFIKIGKFELLHKKGGKH